MTITYNWIAESVRAVPEYNGNKNVVVSADWRCNCTDGEYKSTSYGTVGIDYTNEATFIDLENLTNDDIVSWIKISLGEEEVGLIELSLSGEINYMKNPQIVKNIINS